MAESAPIVKQHVVKRQPTEKCYNHCTCIFQNILVAVENYSVFEHCNMIVCINITTNR